MNIKHSTLAAAVTAALAMGAAGQASAYIYGGAGMDIQDLDVQIFSVTGFDENGAPIVQLATINSFDFRTTTQADLNGVTTVQPTQTCSGTTTTNTCGASGPGLVLNSAPASDGIVRVDNAFSFLGPGGGEFGSSDNVIWDAALVGDDYTHVQGIAEAELVSGTSAGATSTIRSTTGFTFTFTIDGESGFFNLGFLADPDLYAELIDPTALGGTASASVTTTFRLSGNGITVSWAPEGLDGNQCGVTGAGVACVETADTANLNTDVSAAFGQSDESSWDPTQSMLTAFGIGITGLTAGTYSFTLQTTQEANVTRIARVPEPGVLALLGIGLLGMGAAARRKNRA